MKAEAPQAPVSHSGKNRKTRGVGPSSALVKGPRKGSTLFQQLLAGRAAHKGIAAGLLSGTGETKSATRLLAEAVGLKSTTHPLHGNSRLAAGGIKAASAERIVSEAEAGHTKAEVARKAAAAAQHVVLVSVAAPHPGTPGTGHAVKEQKKEPAETAKAPVVEPRPSAHRAEPLIRVVDLRHSQKPVRPADIAESKKREASPAADRDSGLPLAARLGQPHTTIVETPPRTPSAPLSHAATPLERLREMAGSELVRASNLILRDGGGEIRLVLKPESLGSVRVRMNVVDNRIEGHIIVDSAAVKHVFDGSVDALRRALTAEGFQMGSLQVSVGGQDARADQDHQQWQAPAAVRQVTAQGFEKNVPGVEELSLGDLFVDLFV